MSVISSRSKRKTKKGLAKHGAKGAATVAPYAVKAGAAAHHARKVAGSQASILADGAKARGTALGSQAAGHWKEHGAPALSRAASDAGSSAMAARDWAAPRIAEAGEMSKAQLTQAYGRGVEAAAPKVEQAASALAPKVDHARDRIVDDLLPRLVGSVSAAASAASDKVAETTESAASAGRGGLSSVESSAKGAKADGKKAQRAGKGKAVALRGKVEVQQRGSGIKTFLLVSAILGAAAAAGWAVWKSKAPKDPWVPATGGDQTRLSHPGEGSGLGSGGLASSSADVDTPAPDGRTATPDESGSATTPAPHGTSATGPSPASVVPPRTNPPKSAGSTTPEQARAADPEAARAHDVQAEGMASEVTETVVRPAPRSTSKDTAKDSSTGKPSTPNS